MAIRFILCCAALILLSTPAFAQNPTISLEAVKINDVAITPSNSITVNPGDIIDAEIFASNWSPNGEKLWIFEVAIDRHSFISGDAGSVKPIGWDRPLLGTDDSECVPTADDCPDEWPVCALTDPMNEPTPTATRVCVGPSYDPQLALFVDEPRPDWVFTPCQPSGAPCSSPWLRNFSPNLSTMRLAGFVFLASNARPFSPALGYCGTLRLAVSVDSRGAFGFKFVPSLFGTGLFDELQRRIEPLDWVGLTINVIPCGDGIVDFNEQCDDDGESATCDADCTLAECGDGTLNLTAGEECDEGLNNSDTEPDRCRTDCRLATCGDNVTDADEECDGTDDDSCPGSCSDECSCLQTGIPTVSAWGLIILSLSLLTIGKTYFGRRYRHDPDPGV